MFITCPPKISSPKQCRVNNQSTSVITSFIFQDSTGKFKIGGYFFSVSLVAYGLLFCNGAKWRGGCKAAIMVYSKVSRSCIVYGYIGWLAPFPYHKFMLQLPVLYIEYPVYIRVNILVSNFGVAINSCSLCPNTGCVVVFVIVLLVFLYYLCMWVSAYQAYIHAVHGVVNECFFFSSC